MHCVEGASSYCFWSFDFTFEFVQCFKSKMQNNNRIIFLDWLRVVAFVSVFIGHKFAAIMAVVMNDPATHASMRGLLSFLYPFVHGGGLEL